jgi:hypothetical protein
MSLLSGYRMRSSLQVRASECSIDFMLFSALKLAALTERTRKFPQGLPAVLTLHPSRVRRDIHYSLQCWLGLRDDPGVSQLDRKIVSIDPAESPVPVTNLTKAEKFPGSTMASPPILGRCWSNIAVALIDPATGILGAVARLRQL